MANESEPVKQRYALAVKDENGVGHESDKQAPRRSWAVTAWVIAFSVMCLICIYQFEEIRELNHLAEYLGTDRDYWKGQHEKVTAMLHETEKQAEEVQELHNQAIAKWSGQYYAAKSKLDYYESRVRVYVVSTNMEPLIKPDGYYHIYGCAKMSSGNEVFTTSDNVPSKYKHCLACMPLDWIANYMKYATAKERDLIVERIEDDCGYWSLEASSVRYYKESCEKSEVEPWIPSYMK